MYTTIDSVKLRLGAFAELIFARLTDDDIEAFITDAGALIDSWLVSVATLPLDPVPPLVAHLAAAIACRNLWAAKVARDLPAHIKDDYDRALHTLELLAKGTLHLDAPDPESASYNDLLSSATERVFGEHL